MTQQFENFVNAALDKSLASDVTLPTADKIPVFTGIGRQVTGKTKAELGLATSSQLTDKADLVDGLVPANQLPSYVDDVLEYANLASFPLLGEASKLYIAIDTNLVYRWSGSTYAVTSSSLALGETLSTAYRGDRGKTAYDHSQLTGNPHGATTANINDSTDKRYVTDAQRTRVNTAASSGADGYLTSTDWTTFNGKQAALANVITEGQYGNSTQYAIPTFNEKGICTSVTLQTVTAGDTVLYLASGSNTVLAANTNYTMFVAADCELDCALLTGYVRLVNLVASTVSVLFGFPAGTNQYNEGGINANTVELAGFGTAISTRNPALPTQRRVARPQNALLGDIRWYPAMGSPEYYNWTGILTDTRNLILPDANVNFGDLPSVATSYTTGGMAGTRPQCVGGSLNVFNGGTDNVAIGSTSCTLHGTSNTIVNSQTSTLTTSSSNCVVLGGNGVTLDASTRVAAINSRFCNVYGTDNAVINTSYGNIGASATKCSIVGGYGISGTVQYIGNTDVTNVNFFGTVSCTTNSDCEDVTLLNCRKFIATSTQKRLTALNVTKFSDGSTIAFPDTTLLVGTNGYLKATVKLYAVTAADTVPVEALANNATFPTTNKRVKSFITTDTDLQGIGRVLHKVSVAIRDTATGNNVTFATRYVVTVGSSVILAPTANGTTDINIGSGVAFTLTASASGGALYLSIASTGSVASTAVLVVESEYF